MIDKGEGSQDKSSIAYLKGDKRQQAIFMDNLTGCLVVNPPPPFPTASLKGQMLSVLDEELLSINCVEPSESNRVWKSILAFLTPACYSMSTKENW